MNEHPTWTCRCGAAGPGGLRSLRAHIVGPAEVCATNHDPWEHDCGVAGDGLESLTAHLVACSAGESNEQMRATMRRVFADGVTHVLGNLSSALLAAHGGVSRSDGWSGQMMNQESRKVHDAIDAALAPFGAEWSVRGTMPRWEDEIIEHLRARAEKAEARLSTLGASKEGA